MPNTVTHEDVVYTAKGKDGTLPTIRGSFTQFGAMAISVKKLRHGTASRLHRGHA